MTQKTLNLNSAPGHQVLAAAGKKILRPGGKAATQQLWEWANFKSGETVLELAASFGESAIALAKQFGVRVVGVEKNPESVVRARANIDAAGVADLVEVIEGDIFQLDAIAEQFDYVLAEAILTMQSPPGKAKLLRSIHDRLKPGGRFLSHELLVISDSSGVDGANREAEIHRALAQSIRVNSTPLTEAHWIEACKTADLSVSQHQTGAMGLLNPARIVADEGWGSAAKFFWKVLTQAQLRQRILSMRQVFQQYKSELGYIVFVAERP
ncbi:MAG TPA: class I SAM-dependent methyltransferase [Leptolyngbya sp.]|jgi:cyclopropane fatty-acyl-phospholipid synthase-like methyltransferase|nr:class I SAM-dependent methyltransferase [Leptolyngbya sp.]